MKKGLFVRLELKVVEGIEVVGLFVVMVDIKEQKKREKCVH